MNRNVFFSDKQVDFINYLLFHVRKGKEKLPSITAIAKDLGVSTTNVREQLAIARLLGLINIQPRKGITILPYEFSPAVTKSLFYAVYEKKRHFEQYSDLRNQLEKAYFLDAVATLNDTDINQMQTIVNKAFLKLEGFPVQIPHNEHKDFHLLIYKHIDNIFLIGLLRAYWDMYEIVGLNLYSDLSYLEQVWNYHKEIANAIRTGDFKTARKLLGEHIELLTTRKNNGRFLDAEKSE